MKNKLIIVSTMLAAASAAVAEISLTENISLEGFVDMSYVHADGKDGDYKMSDNSFTLDQAEIDFLFDFSPVTAQVDIQYLGGDNDEIQLEQAFASYALGNGGVVTGGRYVSFLGFEAVEPTGLYQYSYAYADFFSGDSSWIPGYNDGVKYTVETDTGFFGISLQDGVWWSDNRLGGSGDSNWGAEIAAAFTGTEGLTIFVGAAYDEYEDDGETMDMWLINTYVAYEADAMTYAAELNYGESDYVDHLSALLMANFAYSEQASVTGRISYIEEDEGDYYSWDAIKFTAAHSYAFTDNLALIAEISYVDGSEDMEVTSGTASSDFDELTGAVELLFSF
jgi:hypothetical protein